MLSLKHDYRLFYIETRLYTSCIKSYLSTKVGAKSSCILPGQKGLFEADQASIPLCNDVESAARTYAVYENITYHFLEYGWLEDCHLPCKQRSYTQSVKHFHRTTWGNAHLQSETFYLVIAYSSLDIKTKTETFVYDLGSLFAAAGGNLGLFLGFSCLACLWQIIDWVQQRFSF